MYGTPIITINNENYRGRRDLYLRHEFNGFELNPMFENGALENLYYLWRRPVHLETVEIERSKDGEPIGQKSLLHSFDGKNHKIETGE